ncbi:hypothetical protein OS965_15675 [Streptomyces sp. H27-G5]|uniref:hypothetical protein n=1 Tax=Streptomyces sp. H27-G5 TaxID=2996698 RepID=UPI00227127E1|nr:hypothetical protein [Streptomyces sp. H27-G5]MCY0919599.1 hypothetical protein [Streptomyces sp. H27-G5]
MAYELLSEMQVGGVWTSMVDDMRAGAPVVITRGRQDESSQVTPAKVRFRLNNRHNRYSPRNPRSVNYGLIGRNTPVRFPVLGDYSYLDVPAVAGSQISTPDHASLDITGDIDVRVEMIPSAWVGTYAAPIWEIMGKYQATGNQRSWLMLMSPSGHPQFRWSPDGTSAYTFIVSTEAVPVRRRMAVRATLDVNNGSGGSTTTFYTAATLAGPWVQLGDPVVTAGVTSIYSGTAPLELGDTTGTSFGQLARRYVRAEVRSGIGGTVVAAPDMRALTPGTTSWADTAGRTWTVAAPASVTNRQYRLQAEVSSWTSRADTSGQDVVVPVEGAGILRRLGQGAKALDSTLRRRIPSVGNPRAYWPMEEDRDATQAYSPVPGVAPLQVTGFEFAADDTLGGSRAVPKLNAAASMRGTVPAHAATGSWLVGLVYYWETAPAGTTTMLEYATTGTARRVVITVDATAVTLTGYDAAGATVVTVAVLTAGFGFHGAWTRFEVTATDMGGGNVKYRVGWVDVSGGGWGNDATVTGTPGIVTAVNTRFGPLAADLRLGHLAVFSDTSTVAYQGADDGWLGEGASVRLHRLCAEEGVPIFSDVASTAMGPQRPATLLALLGECEASDRGVLYEDRDALGLRYRSREARYNQPIALTLDYAANREVAPPLEPIDDDQRVRNDIRVTRIGGSSARAVLETGALSVQAPPAGVGTYDESVTLSLATDAQPEQIAGHMLHLGTWTEARYPAVTVDLAAAPHLIPAILDLDIGDRIQIINPPDWLPPGPIDLIVEGYTETRKPPSRFWTITLNCSPAGPWTVSVVDDPVTGRADTSASTLASGVNATATSLSVATVGAPLWTTTGSDLPVDIEVGGEVMRVTAISGASSPQTFTVTRSVNGIAKAQSSSTPVALAQAPIISY